MIYLLSYSKLAWRTIIIMLGASFVLESLDMGVNNVPATLFFMFCTTFLAWVWYCKRVIEKVAVEVVDDESEEEVE